MATFTLKRVDLFPNGTTVEARKRSAFGNVDPAQGTAPPGAADTSAVSDGTSITLTNLLPNTEYVFSGQVGGVWKHTNARTRGPDTANSFSTQNSVAAPGAGATLAILNSPIPPAGVYRILVRTQQSGTIDAVNNNRNILLRQGGNNIMSLRSLSTESTVEIPQVVMDGVSSLNVIANAAAGAGSVYHVDLVATQIA